MNSSFVSVHTWAGTSTLDSGDTPRVIATNASVAGAVPEAVHHRGFRWRGGIGTALLVPATLISLFSQPIPYASWWHVTVLSLAWVTFLAGAGLRFWATLYLGGRKERALVNEGPYSMVRHPLYLGSLLIGLGAGLFLESIAFELAVIVVALIYAVATVPVEEQVLRSRHGAAFDAYATQVPRFWPAWRRFSSPPQIQVDLHALRLEWARASRWVWIPVIGTTVSYLRHQPWWPHLFRAIW